MTRAELVALAQSLYEAGQTPRPQWSILGDATRGVWIEYATRHAAGVVSWWQAPKVGTDAT